MGMVCVNSEGKRKRTVGRKGRNGKGGKIRVVTAREEK